MRKKILRRLNPAAKSLSDPRFRKQIVRDKSKYTRKGKNKAHYIEVVCFKRDTPSEYIAA